MRAGRLCNKITIESATEVQDAWGEPDKTWATYAVAWASIDPIVGREFYQNKQIGSELTHQVEIRYVSGITAKMRVKFGTRYFDVESVINDRERKKSIIMMCRELV